MSDFDAIKKEMSKLLKEIETLKKEEEIYFDDDLDALKKEMEEARKLEVQRTVEKSKDRVMERGMSMSMGRGIGR